MDKVTFDELVNEILEFIENNYQYSWYKSTCTGTYKFNYSGTVVEVFDSGAIYIDDVFAGKYPKVISELKYKHSIWAYYNFKERVAAIENRVKLSKMSTLEKLHYYWNKAIYWLNTYGRKQ